MLHAEKYSITKIIREENIICNKFKHLEREHSTYLIGVQRYAKKHIAIYCDMENPYCDTYCDTPGSFISVYYCP